MRNPVVSLRPTLRILWKYPIFTLVTVLIVAIGVGANTAVFVLIEDILLKPAPGILAPEQLVEIVRVKGPITSGLQSYPNYRDFRDESRVFSGVAAASAQIRTFSLEVGRGTPVSVYGSFVSPNFFRVLGTTPAVGQFPDAGSDSAQQTLVISHELWIREFAGVPDVIGRAVRINGRPFTIAAVAPPRFRGITFIANGIWLPMDSVLQFNGSRDLLENRQIAWLRCFGRLQAGVTPTEAGLQVSALAAQLSTSFPGEGGEVSARLVPLSALPGFFRNAVAAFLAFLAAVTGLILLIAGFNFTGMTLARLESRRREIAVRLSLGATRWRIASQLLLESTSYFILGGFGGLLVSRGILAAVEKLIPQFAVPISLELRIDGSVFVFSLALSVGTGLLAGLLAVLQLSRTDFSDALKSGTHGSAVSRQRLRRTMIVGQIAVSFLLLVIAGLLGRSLQKAANVDLGFDPQDLQLTNIDVSQVNYGQEEGNLFFSELIRRVSAIQGVNGAALAHSLPLGGGGLELGSLREVGTPYSPETQIPVDWNVVSPGYFDTMHIPLLAGREFSEADRAGTLEVAIINESMARRFWPDQNPLGKRLINQSFEGERTLEVVGVVSDGRYRWLGDEARMFIYVPIGQRFFESMTLITRVPAGGRAIHRIGQAIRDLNPHLPISPMEPLTNYIEANLLPHRLATSLSAGLGVIGLLLVITGVYGVTGFWVTQRIRELGIRTALGARRREIFLLVIRQGLGLVAKGLAAGLIVSFAAAELMRSLLFGISPIDPLTFGGLTLALLLVAVVACIVPARRAARLDVVRTLRFE